MRLTWINVIGLRLLRQLQNGDQRDSNACRQDRTEQYQELMGIPLTPRLFSTHPTRSLLSRSLSLHTTPSPPSRITLSTPPFHSVSLLPASLWIPTFPPATREEEPTRRLASRRRAHLPLSLALSIRGGHFHFKNVLESQVGGSTLLGTPPLARVMPNISCHKEPESYCPQQAC